MPCMPVGTGGSARQNGRGIRLDGNDFRFRVIRFQNLADAGNRSARTDARHERGDAAVRILQDLPGGRLAVDRRG